jgi:hypothetical protein
LGGANRGERDDLDDARVVEIVHLAPPFTASTH